MNPEEAYQRLEELAEYYYETAQAVKTPTEYAELGWYILDMTLNILKEIHVNKDITLH